MLFSLVLAVASKEVELWQTFDDFAPRRLMDEGEEMEAMEDPEMDGDEEEPLEGDEMTGDLAEEEEEGLNPLMIAVPAVAVAGAAALFFMNKDNKEKQEDKPLMDRLTVDGLKNDSEVQIAAGATAALTGLGLYALLGGSPTAPASAGFMASTGALATAGAGVLGVAGTLGHRYAKGNWWWQSKPTEGGNNGGNNGGETKTELEKAKEELKQKTKALEKHEAEIGEITKIAAKDRTEEQTNKLTELNGKTEALKEAKTAAETKVEKEKEKKKTKEAEKTTDSE